jgi:hypothetical protein
VDQYLAELPAGVMKAGILNEEEIQKLQLTLWGLLGIHTERYTRGESGSVRVEVAEELFRSICFSIGLQLERSDNISLIKTENVEELLKESWGTIEEMVEEGKALLKEIKATAPKIGNQSYEDTLLGIKAFFKGYDYLFFAHEIPGDIDYQLCHPVADEMLGIEYINEYLRRLKLENEFCNHFPIDKITALLKSYSSDYIELLINIYYPVATNALGRAILNKEDLGLNISSVDRHRLNAHFDSATSEEVENSMNEAVKQVCHQLQIEDEITASYLKQTSDELLARIRAASGNLDGIFISLYEEPAQAETSSQFIDGEVMDDAELRELIDDLNDSESLAEKIDIAKREIHSLADMVDVLNVCFWEEECEQLFSTMSEIELNLLRDYIKNKTDSSQSNTGWEEYLKS